MSFTPYIPQDKAPEELQDQILQVMRPDAELHDKIPRPLRMPMTNLLRVVNSYYSNMIEGNSAVPADILRAEHAVDAPIEAKVGKDLLEVKCHIEAQRRLSDDPIKGLQQAFSDRSNPRYFVAMQQDDRAGFSGPLHGQDDRQG